MTPFLKLVADDLRTRFGNDLSHTIVVFPNKRASLFLNDYLLPPGGAPMWAPHYMAINEFICSLSPLQVADPIETVCRLYKHYVRLTGATEDLDSFYGWGERILSDFDDIDKSMAPAKQLFDSLRDYQLIGQDTGVLSPEQLDQFKRFVSGVNRERQTEVQHRYMHLWNHLHAMYTALRSELEAENLAYEGQLYRSVAEHIEAGTLRLPDQCSQVAFVGLNVLSEVERQLFSALQKQGKVLFYWDYDLDYAAPAADAALPASGTKEAGVFILRNLKEFPNALADSAENFSNFRRSRQDRSMEFIAAPTETAQAQSVTRWLSNPKNFDPQQARETAIVLCNEALLQPVLHALPSQVGEVNVTKGFPLSHTPAYAFIVRRGNELLDSMDSQRLLQAVRNVADQQQADFLTETLMGFVDTLQAEVTREAGEHHTLMGEADSFLDMLGTEAYYQTYTTLSRLRQLVEKRQLLVRPFTLFRLLCQTLGTQSVPFHGEPAQGLQVMGVLETRCLDFRRVLMLSVGEGYLPQKASDASFIPYVLRRYYGLTTAEHKTSVYAYYFHRLLQRAERATLEFNSSTEGLRKGEMSRFMRAMLVEDADQPTDKRIGIRQFQLTSAPRPASHPLAFAPKPNDMAERVMKFISPTKVNTYLHCQLEFYFKYVLGIPENRPEETLISAQDFGTVLHKAAELFYEDLSKGLDRPITPSLLREQLKSGGKASRLSVVKRAFEEVNKERRESKRKDPEPLVVPTDITVEAIESYLHLIIRYEAGENTARPLPASQFSVEGREQELGMDFDVPYGPEDQHTTVHLSGSLDRVDYAWLDDGVKRLRIVDYKTGRAKDEKVEDMEDLFIPDGAKEGNVSFKQPAYALQTFLYALLAHENGLDICQGQRIPIMPTLYFVRSLMNKDFSPCILYEGEDMTDFARVADDFKSQFIDLLSEILDSRIHFKPCLNSDHCKSCAFSELCGR